MKVLFLKSIKKLGQRGDLKNVSDGFARNYLIPKGIAKLAERSSYKLADELKTERENLHQTRKANALDIINKLERLESIEIQMKTNELGGLYDAVSPAQIVSAISKRGINGITENMISVGNKIKQTGHHLVTFTFGDDLKTTLSIEVKKEV